MPNSEIDAPTQPILVVLAWRGGERFRRALRSIREGEDYFQRIILSITSLQDSQDVKSAHDYLRECIRSGTPSKAEIICSQRELPTMQHQGFWIDYLERTGTKPSDWIYWLAYDDELRISGIREFADEARNWPLKDRCAYFGPWAMRHEEADALWDGDPELPLESWTAFAPQEEPLTPVTTWIRDQLIAPTYLQMSGSVTQFRNHKSLIEKFPRKKGPMRIEMATALYSDFVTEFPEPLSIIYGRPNSDRSNYSQETRREDYDLFARALRLSILSPRRVAQGVALIASVIGHKLTLAIHREVPSAEEWRVKGRVTP